jgi:7-carboxy-7-deazaguanine synthase
MDTFFSGVIYNVMVFGQKDPTNAATYELPYSLIDVSKYKSMSELPVFSHGCDSSYSWANRFKSLAIDKTEKEIVDEIISLGISNLGLEFNPKDRIFWRHPKTKNISQLCFTGGEPMLYQKAISAILNELKQRYIAPPLITIETNATKMIEQLELPSYSHLHLSCSPKLYSVSGERDAVKLDVIKKYIGFASSGALKFVHNGTQEAWDELDGYIEELSNLIKYNNWDIWIMPVGSTLESQDTTYLSNLVTEALRRGYYISHRVHISVFGNKIGT